MRRMGFGILVLVGLLVLSVPSANAQLHLVAQKATMSSTLLTPLDTTVLSTTESPIFALKVPPIPLARYVQLTSSAVWQLDLLGEAPTRAKLQLVFNVTSPVLPPETILKFGVPLTFFGNPNGLGGFQGGTGVDSEVLTRKLLADYLVIENEGLTETSASQIVDLLFLQGFDVSVSARLRSWNVGDAEVMNTNVAFFAEPLGIQ